jgi:hypothetical protein
LLLLLQLLQKHLLLLLQLLEQLLLLLLLLLEVRQGPYRAGAGHPSITAACTSCFSSSSNFTADFQASNSSVSGWLLLLLLTKLLMLRCAANITTSWCLRLLLLLISRDLASRWHGSSLYGLWGGSGTSTRGLLLLLLLLLLQ